MTDPAPLSDADMSNVVAEIAAAANGSDLHRALADLILEPEIEAVMHYTFDHERKGNAEDREALAHLSDDELLLHYRVPPEGKATAHDVNVWAELRTRKLGPYAPAGGE